MKEIAAKMGVARMDKCIHGLSSWILSALSCPHSRSAMAIPCMGEKEEIHYASLRFQRIQRGNPQEQEVIDEYSGIR